MEKLDSLCINAHPHFGSGCGRTVPTAAIPASCWMRHRWHTPCLQKQMVHDPACPQWQNRDRFVLSAGHGSMLLYSLLHLFGYGLPMDELKKIPPMGKPYARPSGIRPDHRRGSDDGGRWDKASAWQVGMGDGGGALKREV